MQSIVDIVRFYYFALDRGDLVKAGLYLSDDFLSYGSRPGSLNKREALNVIHTLQTAMPDLKHALSNFSYEGSLVRITVQAGGRHVRPLDLSHLRLGIKEGIVPGSGKMIIFLPENYEYTVEDGKITVERNVSPITIYGGVNGFLNAIGFAG